MKYSTGLRKRSRLQGHRKRRRVPEALKSQGEAGLSIMEYRTIKQYRPMGDALDEFKTYGYRAGVENILTSGASVSLAGGHNWLTAEVDSTDPS
jgi:hypothetical protein